MATLNQHSIVLRAARPTFDEGLVCARYLDEAAEGFNRIWLGRRVAQIIANAYVQPDHNYSFQNVTFAELDDQVVGMALGFNARQYRQFSEQPLKEAAGGHALRMTVVKILLGPMFRIMETISDDEFYLLAIAVDKEMRGEGVGAALMDSTEERARAGGAARLSLDVSSGNKSARRLYERLGMTVESQWPKHMPMLYRMTRAL